MPPPADRIILRCWISWTPAAIRPPPPHPHLPLQRPSSRATPPAPPRRPTPHPKATGTAASTSQVSPSSTSQTIQSQMKMCTLIHFAAQIRGQFISVLSSFLSLYVTLTLKHQCAFFVFYFLGSFFKFKASTNLCSLPVPPVTLLPLFPAKAACYFQHRQQFIFPGELTAREPSCCVIIILPSPLHPPQRLFLPAAPSVLSACSALSGSWRLVQLSVCVCMRVRACQQGRVAWWDLSGSLIPSAGRSWKQHGLPSSKCGGR